MDFEYFNKKKLCLFQVLTMPDEKLCLLKYFFDHPIQICVLKVGDCFW